MIQNYTLLGALGIFCIEDMREKKITISTVLFSAILGICLHLFFQTESIFSMILGMVPGICLLLVSLVSKGRLGIGDALLFMVSGLYLGWEKTVCLISYSSLLCGIWALMLVFLLKKEKNYEIPFVPFLFAAYLGMVIL